MSDKLKLSKIILETKAGKEVPLSLEEAQELHQQLDTLFGKKEVFVPSTPVVIERDRWPYTSPSLWYSNSSAPLSFQDKFEGDSGLAISYCGTACE